MRRAGVFVALGLLGLIACGTKIPTTVEGEEITPGPTGADAGPSSSDGLTDGSVAIPDVAADTYVPPPTGGNGTVDPCAASYRPGASDVYVVEEGANDADCGTTANPCSLARALEKKPQTINIADGTYPLAVKLESTSIRIFGGWKVEASGWTRSCETGKVKLASPEAVGLSIDGSAVTLSYVDVSSKATPAVAESLYGMVVTRQSRVTLDHVKIVAGPGGSGADGQGRAATTLLALCTPASDGLPGPAGASGANGAIAFGPTGIVEVSKPTDGARGVDGHPGKPAIEPVAPGYKGIKCVAPEPTGGPIVLGCVNQECEHRIAGYVGTNGCGGAVGMGGAAGSNAGSSIALYVSARSTVSMIDGALESGNGGSAGKGSDGGDGAKGSAGEAGEGRIDADCPDDFAICSSRDAPKCENNGGSSPFVAPGGDPGGTGGEGGKGGKGGDGAGGHSLGWACGTSSSVELTGSTVKPGAAGAGAGPAKVGESFTFAE